MLPPKGAMRHRAPQASLARTHRPAPTTPAASIADRNRAVEPVQPGRRGAPREHRLPPPDRPDRRLEALPRSACPSSSPNVGRVEGRGVDWDHLLIRAGDRDRRLVNRKLQPAVGGHERVQRTCSRERTFMSPGQANSARAAAIDPIRDGTALYRAVLRRSLGEGNRCLPYRKLLASAEHSDCSLGE